MQISNPSCSLLPIKASDTMLHMNFSPGDRVALHMQMTAMNSEGHYGLPNPSMVVGKVLEDELECWYTTGTEVKSVVIPKCIVVHSVLTEALKVEASPEVDRPSQHQPETEDADDRKRRGWKRTRN